MDYELAVKNIRSELKDYIVKGNLQSLVIGVSGGIDSAVCLALAKPICDELGIPLIGRSLPTRTNTTGENSRAKRLGAAFCTEFLETSIQSGFTKLSDLIDENYEVYPEEDDHKDNIRFGNIKARLRMILLYDLASANDGLVLSTDNWTEYLLGFWTLHGDVGDYGMIQELWKTEVYDIADYLVRYELTDGAQLSMKNTIEADATDGLGISPTDLDQIMPGWEGNSRDGYAKVDSILRNHIKSGWGDLDDLVLQRYHRTEFKRNNPYNIKRNDIEN
jgi:NAD+ synthase